MVEMTDEELSLLLTCWHSTLFMIRGRSRTREKQNFSINSFFSQLRELLKPPPMKRQDIVDVPSTITMPYGLPSASHAGTYSSESAAWLRWRKTRAEVFGHDVEPWTDGWAFHFIFPTWFESSGLHMAALTE